MYLEINKLYEAFKHKMEFMAIRARKDRISIENIMNIRRMMKTYFIIECSSKCPNIDILSNIVIDLCYKSINSKQFTWDICGNYIISNLLMKNNNIIHYPILDNKNPEFYYCGNGYKMEKYKYNKKEIDAQWF
jgi:hypothetical protein